MKVTGEAQVNEASAADLAAIRALLAAHGLPVADLEQSPPLRFWVAREGGKVQAAIGLEAHGRSAVLRSLVVAPALRGRGLAGVLVTTLEAQARHSGIARLVLLTETAADFFTRHGYALIARAAAPAEVQDCAEFRALCPASAQCLLKTLS